MKSAAIVTVVIGEKYGRLYDHYFRKSQSTYAKKIGADFFVVDQYIDTKKKHRQPTWQKLLMFNLSSINKYERVLFLDGDVYVKREAENIFPLVEENKWGAVKNNAQELARIYESDKGLLFQCPTENRPEHLINSGALVLNQKNHRMIMEKVYNLYKDQSCGEQGPISYHLINESTGELLPKSFNTVISDFLEKYGWKLSSLVALQRQANFIHSAGGLNKTVIGMVSLFDRHPSFFNMINRLSRISIIDHIGGKILKIIQTIRWRVNHLFNI